MAELERVPTIVVESQAHDVVAESLNNVTSDIVSGELVQQILTDIQGGEVEDEVVDEVDRIVEDASTGFNSLVDFEVAATELSESVYDEDDDIIVAVDESNRHVTGRNSRTISVTLSREVSLAQIDVESSDSDEEGRPIAFSGFFDGRIQKKFLYETYKILMSYSSIRLVVRTSTTHCTFTCVLCLSIFKNSFHQSQLQNPNTRQSKSSLSERALRTMQGTQCPRVER